MQIANIYLTTAMWMVKIHYLLEALKYTHATYVGKIYLRYVILKPVMYSNGHENDVRAYA